MGSHRNYKTWQTSCNSGKDFKDSYKQTAWANAVARHTKLKKMLAEFKSQDTRAHIERWISEIEDKYPQLKE